MEIKRLSQCTLDEAIEAWNRGFEGYFVQIKMEYDLFIKRMAAEDLSPHLSIVAFDEGLPVGIVMNGTRTIDRKKVAWNGGTGIASSIRGRGLSKVLMDTTLRIYEEEGVEIATLEAIDQNEPAINLYKKFGYEISDQLVYLSKNTDCDEFRALKSYGYSCKRVVPEQLSSLEIYDYDAPWQCQWQSVRQGEALILNNSENKPVGYCLYKKVLNSEGKVEKLLLYQLKVGELEQSDILINEAVTTVDSITIMAINFSVSNPVTPYLMEKGFEKTVGQVNMKKICF